MLQQTQVATVLPYYREWLRRFPDFFALAAASENDVLHSWQGLGYYSRARNLHAAARMLVERGTFPDEIEEIRALPGVGRYTANAVATFAFDRAVPIVEVNIARLLARLSDLQLPIDSAPGNKTIWDLASALVPKRDAGRFNSALMDLGALVCTARHPKCELCPVRTFCRAVEPERLPLKKSRAPLKKLSEHHGFIRRNGHVLLEQAAERWRGLWILPSMAEPPSGGQPLHRADFPFTHHRITLTVFAADVRPASASQRWFSLAELPAIPMPSPHRRALVALLPPEPA